MTTANLIKVALLSILLAGPMMVQADQVEENPDGIIMMGDLLVARPIGLALLGLGTATYVAIFFARRQCRGRRESIGA